MKLTRCLFTSNTTNTTTLQFFTYLQNNFGGLKNLLDKNTPECPAIITRTDGLIRTQDLKKLMAHECSAIHIQSFYHPQTCREIGNELAEQAIEKGMARNWKVSTSRGLESSDVSTLGSHAPFNVIAGLMNNNEKKNQVDKGNKKGLEQKTDKESIMNDYFEGVQKELRDRRWKVGKNNEIQKEESQQIDRKPQLWPLDKLRLELDEAWPGGAGLAKEKEGLQRPFSGGLPRVMVGPTRWKKGFIHVDEMAPLSSSNGLFSANIYLQQPRADTKIESTQNSQINENGGDLHIWPLGIRSRLDWYKVRFKKLFLNVFSFISSIHALTCNLIRLMHGRSFIIIVNSLPKRTHFYFRVYRRKIPQCK